MSTEASVTRFTSLSIDGFRRLKEVKLELRPLNVMIGANGTGKTSVLDVLSLLSNSAQGQLSKSISDLSGLGAILTFDRADVLRMALSVKRENEEPLDYHLYLSRQGVGYSINREALTERSQWNGEQQLHQMYVQSLSDGVSYFEGSTGRNLRPSWDYNPLESALSQAPKMFLEAEAFRQLLGSSTHYHVLNVDRLAPVRSPQPLQPALLPGANGEDLASCLFNLRETDRDRFEAIEDLLRVAFPRFVRLDFPPVAAGTLALTWREASFSRPLYMHQLSEGTLRFLWLATLLNSPGLTALTLLDEPEVSLHPELLSLLADLMREASRRTQLVVATHSDLLIRFLKPEEVIVIDPTDEGMSTLTWAETLDIEEWLKDYSLDELWQNGRLGARP